MTIKTHTHDLTLRFLAGASAQGSLLFHQVFQRHVSPSIRRPQEPEPPELWQQFCDGYEVSSHGRVRSRRQVLVNLLDSREEPIQVIRGKWYRVKRLVAELKVLTFFSAVWFVLINWQAFASANLEKN